VMAHELGHVLLHSKRHGPGVMAKRLGLDGLRAVARGELLFTPAEARRIRRRLSH
jgi:hypothetical protein